MNNENCSNIIAIVNQKGGVGKSTTAINLSACLSELGKKVLLLDLDPQGNTTSGLGLNKNQRQKCIYNALIDNQPIDSLVEKTDFSNLGLVPATISLAGAEIELVTALSRENKLKNAIEESKNNYDYMIIDCPPSLGLLTINALTAAKQIIIPIQCEYYAMEGLSKLTETIKLVRANLNPNLEIAGVLMTMFDARTNLSKEVVKEVRDFFSDKVYKSIIPRSVRLSEAPSYGQPIITYDSSGTGAIAYRDLAKEVIA
ncbi:MAG: ParA family protein [Actinobacteria bacterium]|nr:MAG: ParA family protein [Actinomycetota bacterium]